MHIRTENATVYFSPTSGRRFLTKKAAINKEARAIIKKYFPDERGCNGVCSHCEYPGCGDPGWTLEVDEPERFARYYMKLTAALKRAMP